MRWQGRKQSSNVQDRRGDRPVSSRAGMGILQLIPLVHRIFGTKGVLLVALVGSGYWLFQGYSGEGDSLSGAPSNVNPDQAIVQSEQERTLVQFVSTVLADTETTWAQIFLTLGKQYEEPTLILYRGATSSGCGTGTAEIGPFYCPLDQRIYIDLGFYEQLANRYGAPGDFAQAYVLAHEVGHHVQTVLGISSQVNEMGRNKSQAIVNRLSVLQELQADCYAGVWGFYANTQRGMLEPGDIEEALKAAAAIGDDTLQRQTGGRVAPDSFTHGSSEQRASWFKRGFTSGEVSACDTFSEITL